MMNGGIWGFLIVSLFLLLSSLGVVLSKNLFRSVLFLALMLISTAIIYLFLGAELLAAVQILLYTGGVITLVIFAIMLTERMVGEKLSHTNRGIFAGAVFSIVFLIIVGFTLLRAFIPSGMGGAEGNSLFNLGRSIFSRYVLPFEVLSILLVAAIIGALVISRKEE
jgi:NADH-quinone oxidoreductase subunit J